MTKTINILAVIGVVLTAASTVHAQTPSPEGTYFVTISAGSQPQKRTFNSSSTFTSFGETGSVSTNQGVGSGFVFDATVGYHITPHLGFGIGVWTGQGKGSAASTVSLPDPLFVGRFTTINLNSDDLKQTDVAVNFQLLWRIPITNRFEIMLSGGPTILHVSQEVGIVDVTPNTTNATMSVDKQSATTAKAGNAGLNAMFRVTDHIGVGLLVRYAGGSVDLPSVEGLSVAGAQVGGTLKYGF
jgi:hypothetical protein